MLKKILFLFLIPAIIFSGFNFAKAGSQTDNLIPNANLIQIGSNGSPTGWLMGNWGTNSAAFGFQNNSSTPSLSVTLSSYSSGDAKWYFSPISATPNSQYIYSDSFISNVATEIVVQIANANGNFSYQDLGSDPASSAWQSKSFLFTAPSNASQITVFHLINQVGTLQTKDFSLTTYTPQIIKDSIPNGSLETVSSQNSSLPQDWQTSDWGTNTAKFTYLNTGHTGKHSVKVTIARWSSGAAEWYYTPQAVTPGANFVFSDYYIATVPTEVDLMVNKTDGTTQFITLGTLSASSVWSPYVARFIMPADAQTASIMQILYQNGSLTTDDYSLATYIPQKFSRPIVSLTFDDALESQYTNALPMLNQYNDKATFYILTGSLGDSADGYMSLSDVKAINKAGDEIGSHTVTHPDLTTVSSKKLTNELVNAKNYLQTNLGITVSNFAVPYGTYNTTVTNAIKKYYRSDRTTDEGYNTPDNFDPYHIVVQNMTVDTTLAEFQSWVDYAEQNDCWLVIVYHQVDTGGDTYSTTPANFAAQLSYINQTGLTVETVNQALNEASSQITK